MLLIPAIDLKGGRCVRLSQGEFTRVETYSEDPLRYARRWLEEGAERLHIVDLDGARLGVPQTQNLEVVRQIIRRTGLPVQMGGGVRSLEIAERMLRIGADRVILGTAVAREEAAARDLFARLGDRAIVGIDARDGRVAVSGWQEQLEAPAVEFALRMVALGARRIAFTDIARDGMLAGANLPPLRALLDAVSVPVIASGGVTTLDDVRALSAMEPPAPEAAIVGKALYAGTLRLADAIAVARGGTP